MTQPVRACRNRSAVDADQLEGVTRQDHLQPGAPGHALEARHDRRDARRLHRATGQGADPPVLSLEGPARRPIEGDRADCAYPVQRATAGTIRLHVAVSEKYVRADSQGSLAPAPAAAGRAPGE